MSYYQISDKVSYIVTDNAANMKKAFRASFPLEQQSTDDIEDDTDSDDLWNHDDSADVVDYERERLSCFAHSLQLTVADGLKETKAVSGALSKAVSISSILHRSTSYKVSFQRECVDFLSLCRSMDEHCENNFLFCLSHSKSCFTTFSFRQTVMLQQYNPKPIFPFNLNRRYLRKPLERLECLQ